MKTLEVSTMGNAVLGRIASSADHIKWYRAHMPPHATYVEPYFGSFMLFALPRAKVEILNDPTGEVVNFFAVQRDAATAAALIQSLLAGQKSLNDDTLSAEVKTSVARARRFAISARRYLSLVAGDALEDVCKRLAGVQCESNHPITILKRMDTHRSCFFTSPPWNQMDIEEQTELLTALNGVEGKVMLCGHPSELLQPMLRNWRREERTMKPGPAEVIWMKHPSYD